MTFSGPLSFSSLCGNPTSGGEPTYGVKVIREDLREPGSLFRVLAQEVEAVFAVGRRVGEARGVGGVGGR